jgi:Ca-activated chloride channel family protein
MLLALIVLVRRPRIAAALLVVLLLPRPSFAADLWLRPDQRAHRAVERGIEQYRRGDFAGAAASFAKADTADAHYDRGNALAKAGKLEDAVAAYDQALRRAPGMADAAANRAAVLAAIKRRQAGRSGQSGNKGDASKPSQQSRECAAGDAQCQAQQKSPHTPQKGAQSQPSQASPPKPADAGKQAQADAAQRARMQQAIREAKAKSSKPASPQLTPAQRERRLSDEAALMRVPDEPGNLLREKFRLEYERRQMGGSPP